MRMIILRILAVRRSVEYVIRGEVNKPGVKLAAGHRKITDGETIGNEGRQRLILGDVYLIIGGCVDYDGRIGVRQGVFHDCGVADIDLGTIEALHQVATLREDANQLNAELSTAPKNNHIASVH